MPLLALIAVGFAYVLLGWFILRKVFYTYMFDPTPEFPGSANERKWGAIGVLAGTFIYIHIPAARHAMSMGVGKQALALLNSPVGFHWDEIFGFMFGVYIILSAFTAFGFYFVFRELGAGVKGAIIIALGLNLIVVPIIGIPWYFARIHAWQWLYQVMS